MKSKRSRNSVSKSEALSLLRKEGCPDRLMGHVTAVSKNAKDIAEKIKSNGYDIDVEFVEVAALLHDIGRCRTHGIMHGIEGARIMQDISPGIARVCERHIGAGIDRKEAASLGLPPKDYLPETLEEKVIAHADNLVQGDKIVSIEDAVKEFEEKLGKGHPAVERVKKLDEYIQGLMKNAKT